MKLAWNPRPGIPAGPESLPVAEEGPGNYHRDKCKGPRLGEEGASTGIFKLSGCDRPFTRDAPTS
jgi:hypothetical protein